MLPSADPLMKQSSTESTARALTGESWAWKLCRWCLLGSSKTLIQPLRPPVMSSCRLGATESTVAPESWQQNATEQTRGTIGILLFSELLETKRLFWSTNKSKRDNSNPRNKTPCEASYRARGCWQESLECPKDTHFCGQEKQNTSLFGLFNTSRRSVFI